MSSEEQIVEATGTLCGHWTFFGPRGSEELARCDLQAGHAGTTHTFWLNPLAGEKCEWDESHERHRINASSPPASVPSPPEPPERDPFTADFHGYMT